MTRQIVLRVMTHLVCVALALLATAPRIVEANVASEAAEYLGKQFFKALGKEAVEFGGERATRELAERLIREGGEGTTERLIRIVEAGDPSTIRAMKNLSGRDLKYLDDVSDGDLVGAVQTLGRGGVADDLATLGSDAARSAALRAEMELPGAGVGLVREFGDDGLAAAGKLTDTQANQLLKVDRIEAVRRLPAVEKRSLLDALASNREAQAQIIRTAGGAAVGGLAVVAGGAVSWHASDVVLPPLAGAAAAVVPQMVDRTIIGAVVLFGFLGCVALVLRHRRLRLRRSQAARPAAS